MAPTASTAATSVYPLGGDGGDDSGDGGGIPGGSTQAGGNILMGQVRDMEGSKVATEAAIASGDDGNAVGWCNGAYYGSLYTRSGVGYVKQTPNPNDWSVTEVAANESGALRGLAKNSFGVLLGFINGSTIVSRDGGITWNSVGAAPGGAMGVVAEGEAFVAICFDGAEPKHKVSINAGVS